jgi:PAS domain S-box-containing protein
VTPPSRILHVTDDPELEAGLSHAFGEDLTYEVCSATSVNEALQLLLDGEDFACIISDHDLPDVDGLAFLETVRVQNPDLPFVLFTSEGSERVASRAIHARVTDYLIRDRLTDQWDHLAVLIDQAIEFHRSRAPLGERHIRAEVILEAAIDAMAIVQNNTFVYANQPALALFGIEDREDLARLTPSAVVSPETRDLTAATFRAIQRGTRHIDRLDQVIVGIDGIATPVQLTAAAIEWRAGPAILLICRDLRDLAVHARELERRNARIRELERLVAHQIRSPLAAAQGRLVLLRADCESLHLEPLGKAVDRIATILEDSSVLAELRDTVVESEPVSVPDLIAYCWQLIQPSEAALEVVDDVTIRGDPDRLSHLFENLLRNAVEHGGPAVSIRIGRVGESCIYVEDDGPGIPEEIRERVLDPKRTSVTGDSGLGLLIVTWIAEAHDWEVAITDGRDGGARFEFGNVAFVP